MIARDEKPSHRVHWEAIRERFERLQRTADQAGELTAEQSEEVMAQRARLLAQIPKEAPDTSQILEVMILQWAEELFALETQFVREVCRIANVTPIPGGPAFLKGVTNLRGQVLAVMDLREIFGVQTGNSEQMQTIVLGSSRTEFGILVDAVHEVTTLRIDEILEPPGSVAGMPRDYLRGVTEAAMLVLDGQALLADERLHMDEHY